tara:strand:- start:34453 stop:34677 length:225 start_codon:yes stop_codon:yes gene_type:complete
MDNTIVEFVESTQKAINDGRCVETNDANKTPIVHVSIQGNKVKFELSSADDNDSIIETFNISDKKSILNFIIIL